MEGRIVGVVLSESQWLGHFSRPRDLVLGRRISPANSHKSRAHLLCELHFAENSKYEQSRAASINLIPSISLASIAAFTTVHSGIAVNINACMQA